MKIIHPSHRKPSQPRAALQVFGARPCAPDPPPPRPHSGATFMLPTARPSNKHTITFPLHPHCHGVIASLPLSQRMARDRGRQRQATLCAPIPQPQLPPRSGCRAASQCRPSAPHAPPPVTLPFRGHVRPHFLLPAARCQLEPEVSCAWAVLSRSPGLFMETTPREPQSHPV